MRGLTEAERTVRRLDSYSPEEHAAKIAAARERLDESRARALVAFKLIDWDALTLALRSSYRVDRAAYHRKRRNRRKP